MIWEPFLLSLFGTILLITAPLRLLPNASLPAELQTTLDSIGAYISPLTAVFPVLTLFSVFGIIITIELSILSYKLIMWLIRRLPTQS